MNRDVVVAWLGLALGLSLFALLLDATLAFAGGVSATLTLLLLLGAMKRGAVGPVKPWLAASFAAWLAAFAGMHVLPQTATSPDQLWLGLPPATAVMVYGLWLAPLFTATLPYALHFDRFTLNEEELARVEAALDEASRASDASFTLEPVEDGTDDRDDGAVEDEADETPDDQEGT